MDLLSVLQRSANKHPEWSSRWSNGLRVAHRLDVLGLGPGSCIVADAPDSEPLNALLLACWMRHITPAILPPGAGPDMVAPLEADMYLDDLDALAAAGPSGETLAHTARTEVLLSLTSGTTGRPKAAVLGSGPVALATSCIADRQRMRADDVVLCTVPAASSFQLIAAFAPAAHVGARFISGWGLSGSELWETIRREGVTVFLGYGPVLCDLLVAWDRKPSSLRLVMSGGAPVAATVKAEFRTDMGLPFVESYGQSELGGFVAMGDPMDTDPRAMTHCGRPLPDRPAWVEPDGQIVLWGQAMMGYRGQPELSADVLRAPGLWTGDIGEMDADGYLRVLGRDGHQLIDGRWPRDVDDLLYADRGVHHGAVVNVNGSLVAVIQPRPGATIDVASTMDRCGVSDVQVVPALPRTFSGKIDRASIPAMLG
jgi:long-chain acyl-CoA synthetase